jgi:lipopolysaccharide biosynthesis regulator YciM
MDEDKMADFKEDFALLIEAGFIAVKQLDEISATRIFNAAQVLSPSSTAPQIGIGYIALNKLEVKEAVRIFTAVTQIEPENDLAKTFLGICYLLTKGKQKKGEKMIQEAMQQTTDATIKNLGSIALEWAEKDLLQKSKAPFFVQKSSPSQEENKE